MVECCDELFLIVKIIKFINKSIILVRFRINPLKTLSFFFPKRSLLLKCHLYK